MFNVRGKRKTRLKILSMILVLAMTVMAAAGCSSKFDASGYAKAVLDLNFQGETEGALRVMEGATESSLQMQYKEFIESFVENNITAGLDVGDVKITKFGELVSKILTTMRYSVGEADKTDGKGYKVPVQIQPSDVFLRFQELSAKDADKIAQKAEKGEYTGTEEEMQAQIIADVINHAYELLDKAFSEARYGEEKTVILTVKADENNQYAIEEADMNNLMIKILRLDEIQG